MVPLHRGKFLLLLRLQMSWKRVLPSHSCGGTLQNLDLKLLHSSMQTSADHRSRRRHVSHMTDEKGETWSPSGMSKVRSRPESLVADCSMHALQPPESCSSSCAYIFKFLYGPPRFFLRGKFIPKIAILGDFGGRKATLLKPQK